MGNFYTNVTLRSDDARPVVAALEEMRRDAYVLSAGGGYLVVFDRACDEHADGLVEFAGELSRRVGCVALAVGNADDDVLWYALHARGRLVDAYDSSAAAGDEGDEASPRGGDAGALCRSLGVREREAAVREILDGPRPTFEVERHHALVEALGLPHAAVATGYDYILAGELGEIAPADLLRVGKAPDAAIGEGRVTLTESIPERGALPRWRIAPALVPVVGEGPYDANEIGKRVLEYLQKHRLLDMRGFTPSVQLDDTLKSLLGKRETIALAELMKELVGSGKYVMHEG